MNVRFPQASVAVPVPPFDANHAAICPPGSVVPSHSIVKFVGFVVQFGFIVSSIVTVAVRVVVFPQSSVAVKITSASPVAPHSLDNPV